MHMRLQGEQVEIRMQRTDLVLMMNFILFDQAAFKSAYEVADRVATFFGALEMQERQAREEELLRQSDEKFVSASG